MSNKRLAKGLAYLTEPAVEAAPPTTAGPSDTQVILMTRRLVDHFAGDLVCETRGKVPAWAVRDSARQPTQIAVMVAKSQRGWALIRWLMGGWIGGQDGD